MPPTLKDKKILVVEDDKFLGDLLAKHLTQEGFQFELAVDGESAMTKAEAVKPDLVLLDLFLPGIDGYEVLKRFKLNAALTSVPVVILSNLGQKDEIDKGMALGAVDFLVKAKFDLFDIVSKIKQVLGVVA